VEIVLINILHLNEKFLSAFLREFCNFKKFCICFHEKLILMNFTATLIFCLHFHGTRSNLFFSCQSRYTCSLSKIKTFSPTFCFRQTKFSINFIGGYFMIGLGVVRGKSFLINWLGDRIIDLLRGRSWTRVNNSKSIYAIFD
jgi:hypothetical protein